MRHDPAEAAKSLAGLVERHPSDDFLELCLDLLVEQRRYEVVPLLERYALLQEGPTRGMPG